MLTQITTCDTPPAPAQALLLPPDLRGRWSSRCAQHDHTEAWPSRTVARIACAHPQDWCPACGQDQREEERERALTRWRLTPRGMSLLEQLRAQDALEVATARDMDHRDAVVAYATAGVA
jgi:hypothetical protein